MNLRGEGPKGKFGGGRTESLSVFINYRREDTQAAAGRLSDRLKEHFGEDKVYFDVDEKPGTQWLKEIEARGAAAGVVLCLIGSDWLASMRARSAPAMSGRPDYARKEIEWALSDWSGRLIPVLLDASLPDKYLVPRSLRGIWAKNAMEIRSASFDPDVAVLIEAIEDASSAPAGSIPVKNAVAPGPLPPPNRGRTTISVAKPSEDHYAHVIDQMLDGWVVVFLGPSIRGSLPDSVYLAGALARQYGLPVDSTDLAEVAQRVSLIEGEDRLYGTIKQILAAASKPMPVHHFLAEFPRLVRQRMLPPAPQVIISTNYDWALERAFEAANEPFDYAVYMTGSGHFVHYPWGDDDGEPHAITIDMPREYDRFPIREDVERTVILKVHGAVEGEDQLLIERNSYLVTEDHYLKFLQSQEINDHLPVQILEKIQGRRCLFLGYTLKDWNARLLLRRIWQRTELRNPSWAVEHDPDELELRTWQTIGSVDLLSSDISDYVNQLRAALEARASGSRTEI
jgi:hypothetical protein